MKITRKAITASERTERDTMLQKAINIQDRHWKDGAEPDTRSEEYKKFKKDCDYRGVDAESIWNEAYNVRKDLRKAEASKSMNRKKSINAAESYGWVVDENEAWEAYEFACDYFGKEELDDQIVSSLSVDELASSLAFIFRMNDFREWEERNEEDIEESRKLRGRKSIKSSKRNTRRPVMAMRLTRDFSEFRPWSGAVDTWNTLADYDKLDVLESILDSTYIDENGEGIMSETELNDLLWFEPETVYEWVGLYYNDETGEVSDEPFDDDDYDEDDEDEDIEESTKVRGKKSVKANRKNRVMAANNGNASVSKIKKFIEDSVNNLQTTDYTNCRLVLDDDLCLYVGYSSGFDTEDGYAICAKIAERNDADWADFDYLNMPWNTYNDNDGSTGVFEGDVYDTDTEITPGEDYTQDAQWLADSYVEIRNLLDEGKLTF